MKMKLGIVVGAGTGRELADVFKSVIREFNTLFPEQVEIVECENVFNSYYSLRGKTFDEIQRINKAEIEALLRFYSDFYQEGGRIIFRTAINAEVLYQVRKLGEALKVIPIECASHSILLIRDQTQGFYANDNYTYASEAVSFQGSFSRENFRKLISHAKILAEATLSPGYETWAVYKLHLFGRLFEEWVTVLDPKIKMMQPNNATETLLTKLPTSDRDLLIVAANEFGDIIHEFLLSPFAGKTRFTSCSKNIYLSSKFKGLKEYQTVHGSADSLQGTGKVNPTGMLRAIEAIYRDEVGLSGIDHISAVLNQLPVNTESRMANVLTRFLSEIKRKMINRR